MNKEDPLYDSTEVVPDAVDVWYALNPVSVREHAGRLAYVHPEHGILVSAASGTELARLGKFLDPAYRSGMVVDRVPLTSADDP